MILVRSDDAVKIKYGGTKVVNLQQKLDADCFCADIFDDHGKTINHFVVKNSETIRVFYFRGAFLKKQSVEVAGQRVCVVFRK